MRVFICILSLVFSPVSAEDRCSGFRNNEYCLVHHLLQNYSTNLRPIRDPSRSLDVAIRVVLNSLDEIDVRQEQMKVHAYIGVDWVDEFLVWDPADYGNFSRLTLDAEDIWTPDLVIYNSAGKFNLKEISKDFRVRVNSSGYVRWMFGGLFAAQCEIYIQKYPFDEQKCDIKIGNWGHDIYTSNITVDTVGLSDLWINNTLWELVEQPTFRYELNRKYPRLVYTFKWRRQPRYYEWNLIFPIVLLLSISCWVFWLPVDSGEKIGLSMAVLIAFSVYHSTVLGNTPRTSQEMPALIVFVLGYMFLSTLSTMGACLVIHLGKAYEGSRIKPPEKLKEFARLLSRLFRMTEDDPMNRAADLKDLELQQHIWRFISAMLDKFLFGIFLILCLLYCLCFVIWVRV